MSLLDVPLSPRVASLAGRIANFGRSHHGFRIGYRAASMACAVTLIWCLATVWRRLASTTPLPFGGDAVVGVSTSVLVLLLSGLALRIARRATASAGSGRTGLAHGVLAALARETEVATGLVASLMAGAVVASSPAACEGVSGWFAPALGLSTVGCATMTMLIVGAIGTVSTELARGGISRSLERV